MSCRLSSAALIALLLPLSAGALAAQAGQAGQFSRTPPPGFDPAAPQAGPWNSARALSLVAQARDTRSEVAVDSTLRSYTSRADGFVYFYIDRPDQEERTLIKTDQLALDVYWKAPGLTRQRIVGRRDEKALPTTIQYHLDHLSVVQDEFEDVIRIGDGDEVGDVPHPVGPDAESVYDFRIADSLSLSYGGQREVRVYEVQVRPKDSDAPGFIGSVYLDRDRAAIVRMSFTFTPSSYVDPYLDYIRISLDNALWMEKFWLPYRQEAEIRRELPQLDFLAGSIIRGRFRVAGYDFNGPIPDNFFIGRHVVAAPQAELERFEFEDSLYSDLEDAGLAPSPELEEIQRQVREIGIERALSGLAPARFHLGSTSDLLRYNRAEGLAFGLGTTVRAGPGQLRAVGGWAIGADRFWGRAALDVETGDVGRLRIRTRWDELQDIGPIPGASGVVNSLASSGGDDYLDPFGVREVTATWTRPLTERTTLAVQAGWARHRSEALREAHDDFRRVREIDEGDLTWAGIKVSTGGDVGFQAAIDLRGSDGPTGREWGRLGLQAGWRSTQLPGEWRAELLGAAGWVSSQAPVQALFLLGGRETLPGFPYRTATGDGFALIRARAGRPIWEPWISLHGLAALGWTSDLDLDDLPSSWGMDLQLAEEAEGVRASLGLGLDLLWEVLRIDLARGLNDGGEWQWIFSVAPRFRGWL